MFASEALRRFLRSLNGAASPATADWYRRRLGALVAFLGDVDICTVTVDDLRRWRGALVERTTRYEDHPLRGPIPGGLSPWTLHGYVRAARRWFKWLEGEGLLPSSPARRLELPRTPKIPRKGIAQGDLEKILQVASGSPRDYALVWFLASTGARVGGVVGLRLADLDLEAGRATVREKGNKARTVYLVPRAVEAMRAWFGSRPDIGGDDHVFTGKRGSLSSSGVYQVLKRLAKAAGVEAMWNPHSWRHGMARRLIKSGSGLGLVQLLLGHEDPSVTMDFYGTLDDEELQAAHRRYIGLE